MPFFLALFQLLFIPFQTSAPLASAPRAFSGTDRHEPGEVVEEENALSISRVKRLCFYTNPTSSPHSAAAVLFFMLTVCVWRLPRSTSHSFECKMTQFICLENITLCSNNCFDMIKEFSFINAPGSSFNGK